MNRLGDLQKKDHSVNGEGLATITEEREQKTHGGKNGADGDLRMMQHFIRDFIERPDDGEPL